jgi:hypothetical protein
MNKRSALGAAVSDAAALTEIGLSVGQRVTYTPTGETAIVRSASRSEASGLMMVTLEATCGGSMYVPAGHIREAKG